MLLLLAEFRYRCDMKCEIRQRGRVQFLMLLLLAWVLVFVPFGSIAESNDVRRDKTPYPGKVCLGYNVETQKWGGMGISDPYEAEAQCPRNHAFAFMRRFSGEATPGSAVPLDGVCCPLPDDVLTGEDVYTSEVCPEDTVLTGTKSTATFSEQECQVNSADCFNRWRKSEKLLRCTRINTERYQLGPIQKGVSMGWMRHFRTTFNGRTGRVNIPLSWRYAAGRISKTVWEPISCFGQPWGSIMVGRTSKYCGDYKFRQLFYRQENDELSNTQLVKLVAECDHLSSRFDSDAKCIKY